MTDRKHDIDISEYLDEAILTLRRQQSDDELVINCGDKASIIPKPITLNPYLQFLREMAQINVKLGCQEYLMSREFKEHLLFTPRCYAEQKYSH